MRDDLALPVLAGQLLVCGFRGPKLPDAWRSDLAKGLRAGAILFRHNVPSIEETHALCGEIIAAASGFTEAPPFLGVDQEGGRVTRLPPPFLTLPPMRKLAASGDEAFVERAAHAVGAELAALGFNIDFAPVVDVDSNPNNPIIGDRSFGADPGTVARFAIAFARGLDRAGVMACAKHFPGHGDTHTDSHLELPFVDHPRERLDAIEIAPFAAAIAAGVPTMMTAHVVYDGLDPGVPATLSKRILIDLLRKTLGFDGVLFSDDLGMKAIAARMSIEESAVASIEAGCDVLLVCPNGDTQSRAHEALVREAEKSAAFRERCREAAGRSIAARKRRPPRPAPAAALAGQIGAEGARQIAAAIAALPDLPPR